MKCPKCNTDQDKVIDSRPWKDGAVIRRRRECLSCDYRFTTYEEIEREDLRVVKRDGRYESFDRKKIIGGFFKACEKRPVNPDWIEKTTDNLIEELEQKYGREIPTTAIGEKIMDALKRMDEVAYVRFASVYRQFRDARDFVSEVRSLGGR
ncbi:MAG: transcriptional repressor NrdR [Verrucomicrobia bacterium]|jgi:transcriptional repressor NrdR|nr:transcriptional repressor NrdR [Verrucomicrobiota bacterium]NDC00796.1 transcriptional repressor NrdR [Verrucomicrobiota bacterium]NDF17381.1 transcriptional repressor NrdR [Verrucomicrobiota bacterium]